MVHITNTDANTFELFLFVELTGTPWRDWACRGISQKLKKRIFLAGCGPAHLQESSFGLHWTCSMHRIEACFEEKSQLHFSGIQYHFWISLNWSFGIRTEKGRTTAGQMVLAPNHVTSIWWPKNVCQKSTKIQTVGSNCTNNVSIF